MNFLTNRSFDDISRIVRECASLYVYFSDNDDVKSEDISRIQVEDYISVPNVDVEQCVRALCLAKEGKSSAIYSPFYESAYLPYPIVLSAIGLLYGSENSSYLIIGSKGKWETVLRNVYRHGNVGNHPLSNYYGFNDILNIKHNKKVPKTKSDNYTRWILSGFYNYDLWRQLEDTALIIVDMATGAPPKLNNQDIKEILTYSEITSIPAVFFIKNSMTWVAKFLKANGVEILTPPIELDKHNSTFNPRDYYYHTGSQDLNSFLTDYNLRSYKITNIGLKRTVEIGISEDDEVFSNLYDKYQKLVAGLSNRWYNGNERKVHFLARMLYNSVMEFTGNVDTNAGGRFEWVSHPVGANSVRLYDLIWNLSDPLKKLASEMIDEVNTIMKNFELKITPKGECLRELLKKCIVQNKTVVLLGKKSALSGFFLNTFPENPAIVERLLVDPDQLENAHPSDILILLNLDERNKTKLLTSCSNNIIILSYPWEIDKTKNFIYEAKEILMGNMFLSRGISSNPNNKHVDLIKVKMTGKCNRQEEGEKEVLIKKWNETQNDNLLLNKLNDMIDEDLEEDIDEDVPYTNAISDNNGAYDFPKWVVSIENRDVVIPENRKIVLVKQSKTYLIKAQKLIPGDRILVTKDFNPKPLGEFVWEIMERKFGIQRKTHPGNEWRVKLKGYMNENPGMTYSQILKELKQIHDIKIQTPAAIYLWLESYDVIGPRDFETLETIAKLVDSEDKLKDWWKGLQDIRKMHGMMIRYLWKVFTYNAKELKEKAEEDYVADYNLGLKISEISKLVRLAIITGTPRRFESES